MLLCNLDQSIGPCNGTWLIATIRTTAYRSRDYHRSKHKPTSFYSTNCNVNNRCKMAFHFKENAIFNKDCIAMTVNQSQGQILQKIGLYLPKPIFSHGQLYIAISQVTKKSILKILLKKIMISMLIIRKMLFIKRY